MVDEKDAVEMVDFVEESAGEGAFGFDTDGGAVFKEGFDFNFSGAFDEAVDGGDGKAAFVVFFEFAVGLDDFWVDEGGEVQVFLVVEVVTDDDDAAVEAELGGGHGGGEFKGVRFFPSDGSLAHFGDDVGDFGSDFIDLAAFLTKARVGGRDDFHIIYIIAYFIVKRGGLGLFLRRG